MDVLENVLKCVNCEIHLPFKNKDYIRCSENVCKKENVVLCSKCFSMGAECGPHSRSHPYRVEPAGKTVVLPSCPSNRQWSTEEDEQLIALASQYKCGAWDEVAKAIGGNITASEARNRFDEHFIRGPLGRHAGSNKCWPFIDDRTGLRWAQRGSDLNGKPATGPSEWQYVVEGIRDLEDNINLDDPSWKELVKQKFDHFKQVFENKKGFLYVPNFANSAFVQEKPQVQRHLCALADLPLIHVTFSKNKPKAEAQCTRPPELSTSYLKAKPSFTKRNKRISSTSSEDVEPDTVKQKWSDTESNKSAEIGLSPSTSRGEFSSPLRKGTFVTLGMQSSDDEDLEDNFLSDDKGSKKCSKVRKNMKRKPKKKIRKRKAVVLEKERHFEKQEEISDNLTVFISEGDKGRLRSAMPTAFFNLRQPQPGTSNEILKAKSDDLQLLGYWPGRDDYDIEQANDAERLISQIVINPVSATASHVDEEFENAVKMANIRSYNLTLAARNASKMLIREHGLVDLFFDKIMDVEKDTKPRGIIFNKDYHTKQRLRKQYAEFLKPLHQVALKPEMADVIEHLAARDTLLERVKELQNLKDEGTTVLPAYLRVDLSNVKVIKRKRKAFNIIKKKGVLKYKRYKRWTQKHAESED